MLSSYALHPRNLLNLSWNRPSESSLLEQNRWLFGWRKERAVWKYWKHKIALQFYRQRKGLFWFITAYSRFRDWRRKNVCLSWNGIDFGSSSEVSIIFRKWGYIGTPVAEKHGRATENINFSLCGSLFFTLFDLLFPQNIRT